VKIRGEKEGEAMVVREEEMVVREEEMEGKEIREMGVRVRGGQVDMVSMEMV